ncbi:GNAT family N-acetyltransferase [Polynucleobacter sp. MWH-Adler-W8]|uniref:GNAT family N-acetyltransferase n=1 Tax=Polynucleobacter sp. MWH-Adler-W8 TaxID=1819727 RepID=UPI00092B00A2|nr:GNAT family N-acetyltransferase [Polynucleobacter sp. MWH-Adler-W8]OJI04680.1 GNAT family acetyltransferase [Polynucleobacter sp. MWH-Adler-W8]
MRHNFLVSGSAFRLRPVNDEDAEFIRDLRCDPNLNAFLHATNSITQDQLDWLSSYYQRPNDYYFVVERSDNCVPEGLISLYEVELNTPKQAEWGRWILKSSSLAAVESAALIYKFGFEILDLESIYCRTVASNERVVSFHDSCGIVNRKILKNYFQLGSTSRVDAVEHRLDKKLWPEISTRLQRLSDLTALRLKRIRSS